MNIKNRRFFKIITLFFCIVVFGCTNIKCAMAGDDRSFGVSPMKQEIVLKPGDSYTGSFNVINPSSSSDVFNYRVVVKPFYVDEHYSIYYDEAKEYNQITEWTTLDKSEGTLGVNEVADIKFTIEVPVDAPAGGQYMAIVVQSDDTSSLSGGDGFGIRLKQNMEIAHIVYAEVSGTSIRKSEVENLDVPGFLFDDDITGYSTIKNAGNVHSNAKIILKVSPLFGDEKIYSNEDNPDNVVILPGRSRSVSTSWGETPIAGVFRVAYVVELDGEVFQTDQIVVVCPLWLLFSIFFVIFAVIVWIIVRIRKHKRSYGL